MNWLFFALASVLSGSLTSILIYWYVLSPFGEQFTFWWTCISAVLAVSILITFVTFNLLRIHKKPQLTEDLMMDYRLFIENATDIILLFNLDGTIIEANNAALSAYQYNKAELHAKKINELRADKSSESVAQQLSQPGILIETTHIRKDGTTFPVEVSYQTSIIKGNQIAYTIVRDITGRKQTEEAINYLAYHDVLTGLPNRSLFNERLELEVSHAKREKNLLGVMFLDIDGFKEVNDSLGHATGDQLLVDFAKRLKSCVRASDTVTRLGGDEFTLLLPDLKTEKDLALIAEKIISTLTLPWEIDNYKFTLSASVGIAVFPTDAKDAKTLMKHADTAMYRAKEVGNNYQFYGENM